MERNKEFFSTVNKPRMRVIGPDMTGPNGVRTYRDGPETVCLQIRLQTRFANVHLTFDEARELAERLVAAAAPGDR